MNPLLGFNVTHTLESPMMMWILLAIIAAFVASWLFKKDEKIEDRRRNAAEIAGEFQQRGLNEFAALLVDYSVGDYSGIIQRLKKWRDMLRDPDQRQAYFARATRNLVQFGLTERHTRDEILEIVEKHQLGEEAMAKKAEADKKKKGS